MHASVDDMNLSIGAAVVMMNQLITKIQQLNEDMKPVADIASQIKDISHTLSLLEAAVARMR
jgi:flagellar hook-associated protein FlgK